ADRRGRDEVRRQRARAPVLRGTGPAHLRPERERAAPVPGVRHRAGALGAAALRRGAHEQGHRGADPVRVHRPRDAGDGHRADEAAGSDRPAGRRTDRSARPAGRGHHDRHGTHHRSARGRRSPV
ncbi:MAG: Transcriptional regulator, MerR family, partial [uncultured Blastococcus sp.]